MPAIATQGAPADLAEAKILLKDDTKVKVAGESRGSVNGDNGSRRGGPGRVA